MAVVYEEEGQELGGQAGQIGAKPGIISGGATKSQAAEGVSQEPAKSGSWTNLRQYLDVNRPQAQEMAQNVAGGVQEEVGQAQTALTGAQGQFETQAGETGTAYGQEQQDLIDQATSAPIATAASEDLSGRIANIRDAQYLGPRELSGVADYGGYVKEAQEAREQVGLAGSEEGRETLLGQAYERPTYTSGEKRLDQMLLQTSPEAREEFSPLQALISGEQGLDTQEATAIEQARALGTGRQESTEAATSALREALGGYIPGEEGTGAIGDLMSQIQSGIGEKEAAEQKELRDLKTTTGKDLESLRYGGLKDASEGIRDAVYNDTLGSLIPAGMEVLSANPTVVAAKAKAAAAAEAAVKRVAGGTDFVSASGKTYAAPKMPDVGEDPYWSTSPIQANINTTATVDEVAQANALAQLAGQESYFANPDLAGTYQAFTPEFQNELYRSDLAAALGLELDKLKEAPLPTISQKRIA